MAEIKLVFKPDVSEVSKAVDTIKQKISNGLGNIKITVDSGAAQATQNLAANLQKAAQNAGNLSGDFAKLTTVYSGLERAEDKITRKITETNEALGTRVRVIETIKDEEHSYTTEVIQDNEKIKKSQAELDRAYAQGFAQREKEIQKKQREIWNDFLKETEEYKSQQQKLEDQKIAQAQAANRQMVIDEEEALQKRTAAWKAYFDELNGLSDAKTKQGIEDNKRAILDEAEAQRERTAAWKAYFDEINGLSDAKTKQGIEDNKRAILDEEEAQRKRTAAWKAYFDNLNGMQDARAKQGEMENRQAILDEEEAQKRRTAQWKAYFDNLNKDAEKAERANKANERASTNALSLERQYSNLIRQVQNLKAQYPEGTFDAIEKQAREARDELRNLGRTSRDYAKDVDQLSKTHQGLQRDLANTRQETGKLEKVTESLWMNIQKFARWYVIGNVFTKILNSFREALSTMKEVDTELANIQKVTDRTDAEMQKLAESAYRAASAYGVSAQAYLESAAEFAKAGFGDRAEELAEVAIKTQLVGDVSADVADKFLLASNAAWKMDGNMQLLNKTLDAANIIENNYATSIEKLAAGMPIAASVAANAGMTFEETIAALGTITSVTQETGTKAATALRALILNIIGAVGEYEDGIEVTEESVKSLDGILQVYAKDAMKAAKEAGTVINPMEAIAALAKASEEGLVNQAELFEILSSLGGKLRTNQLISLVQNYDMFLEMLDKTKESAGSADKEIGIMLDTWEAKTNILQNTWTEFIAKTLNSELIKSLLDVGTAILDFADNAGVAAVALAGLFTLFKGKDVIGSAKRAFDDLTKSLKGLSGGFTAVTTWAGLAMTAIAAGIMIYKQIDKARAETVARSAEEAEAYKESVKQNDILLEKLSDEKLDRDELNAIIAKTDEAYAEEAKKIEDINELRAETIRLIGEESKAEAKAYLDKNAAAYLTAKSILENEGIQLKSYQAAVDSYTKQYQQDGRLSWFDTKNLQLAQKKIDELSGRVENARKTVVQYETAQAILNGEYERTAETADKAAESTGNMTSKLDENVPKIKIQVEKLQEASETATKYDTAIGGVVDAMGDFGAGSIEVYNAMKSLEETIPGSTDKLYDFDTATVLAGDDIFTSKEAMLDFIDSSKQLEFSQAISELEDLAAGYWDVAGAALAAMANQQAQAQMAGVLAFTTGNTPQSASAGVEFANLQRQKAEWDAYIATLRGRSGYRSGGSSGSGSRDYTPKSTAPERTTDEELERLKAIVNWEKAELSFLQASGKSLEDINKKRKSIQEALHEQAEYMRSALELMDDTNSTEAERKAYEQAILDLSTEWWSIQKDINDDIAKAEEERKKQLEEEAKLLEEQKKLQQEIFDTLRATVDDYYAKIISGKEKELSLEEKILAVQQAEAALANAQNERNVRYYNAATDQWEWRANAKNVKSAQDALKRAQDALNEYQRQEAWETFKSAWEYVADQIKDGAMTFREAYDYMYNAMKGIQDKYGVDLGLTLEDSIGGFKTLNYGIDGLTQEAANSLGASVGVLRERLEEYEDAVGSFRSSFDEASDKIKNGEMSIEDAYSYLRDRARDIADRYGIDMTGALNQAIAGMDKTNMSIDELWRAVIIQLMKVNSARWFDANTEERALIHAQNEFLGNLIGATYDEKNGYWNYNGSRLYESQRGVSYDLSGNPTSSPTGNGGGTVYDSAGSSGGGSGNTGSSSGGPSSGKSGASWVNQMGQDMLTQATPEQIEDINRMTDAAAAGDWSTVAEISTKLRSNGYFPSFLDANGNTSGIVRSVSGNSAGSTLIMNSGRMAQYGIAPGTVVVDAFGNFMKVGADGHSTRKIDPAELNNDWERWTLAASLSESMTGLPNIDKSVDPAKVAAGLAATANPAWKEKYAYDSGGILKGVGGIKATARDELILGPELTQKATKLAGSVDSNRVLDLVGGLLGAAAKILPFSQNTVGSQYNGSVYQLGNVTMTEGQARTTSVYELAHMASGLGIFNNRT